MKARRRADNSIPRGFPSATGNTSDTSARAASAPALFEPTPRRHARGQGYADLNVLIPGLVGPVAFHKGPYVVRDGDFASAGSVRIDYLDTLGRTR